jgi:SHS2 domain-containing protein
MDANPAGFREIEHTADWELEAWGPDLASLLEQAARGMYALSGVHIQDESWQERSFTLEASDPEGLLVRFLSELLYFEEAEGLAFDRFELQVQPNQLKAHLEGAPIAGLGKEIKAVTYHNLKIQATDRSLSVRIVFDV